MTTVDTSITTPEPGLNPSSGTENRKLHGLLAEFETPGQLLEAADEVRRAGYRWWDCCTPFPVRYMDARLKRASAELRAALALSSAATTP